MLASQGPYHWMDWQSCLLHGPDGRSQICYQPSSVHHTKSRTSPPLPPPPPPPPPPPKKKKKTGPLHNVQSFSPNDIRRSTVQNKILEAPIGNKESCSGYVTLKRANVSKLLAKSQVSLLLLCPCGDFCKLVHISRFQDHPTIIGFRCSGYL